MDNPNIPASNQPAQPVTPSADAEEQKELQEVEQLEKEEKVEAEDDVKKEETQAEELKEETDPDQMKVAPQAALTQTLQNRENQLIQSIQNHSLDVVKELGEESVGQFLEMHEAVDQLVTEMKIEDSEQKAQYLYACQSAISALVKAIAEGDVNLQNSIAQGQLQLASEVEKVVTNFRKSE